MVGREEITLEKEKIIEAIKEVVKRDGKLVQGRVAKYLGVSYPIYLREKQKHGLDPKAVELTPRMKHLEKRNYTEEDFESYMESLDEQTKPRSYDGFEYKFDESIIVAFIADTHIGSDSSSYMRFWNFCKLIKHTSNTKVFLLADLIENFGKFFRGSGIHDQIIPPPEQKDVAKWLIKYLGKDKILGIVQGSHEEFSHAADSFDFSKYVANEIGVPYLGFGGLVILNVGVNRYKVYVAHEDKYYSKNNLCHGLKRICREEQNFDLGVSAHNHVGDMEYFEVKGVPKRAIKLSGYKDPDRFLDKNRFFKKPMLDMCAVFLAEEQKYKNWGIILFEDIDHALRFI